MQGLNLGLPVPSFARDKGFPSLQRGPVANVNCVGEDSRSFQKCRCLCGTLYQSRDLGRAERLPTARGTGGVDRHSSDIPVGPLEGRATTPTQMDLTGPTL